MRLKWLIVVHVALGACLMAGRLIPPDIRFLPLLWALFSVPIAQLMLLSFWAGLGGGRGMRRLLGTLLGVAYLTAWRTVYQMFLQNSGGTTFLDLFVMTYAMYLGCTVFFAGVFLGIRRWKAELRQVPEVATATPPARFQYSLLSLLLIITVASVIFSEISSIRTARGDGDPGAGMFVGMLLFLTIGLVNLLCAVWAALGVGHVGLRVSLVLLVALMLGIAQSLAMSHDRIAIWLPLASAFAMAVVPTAVVVVSLLVVRSCGYRLVPKSIAAGP